MGYEGHELSILLLDDAGITGLNRKYFHRPRPTNVISFPLSDRPPYPSPLGDVVISAETAERQAGAVGGRTEEELLFLLIHGILHLVGYDHLGPAGERKRMEVKERELFSLIRPSRRMAAGRAAPSSE
ncbi:MAG: rRNA maturation RNase YbeY [Deltaproteobacteria bacterium]|nr:rRNA maturation RNase YbeY [Deltaproteobacteria bacterium]